MNEDKASRYHRLNRRARCIWAGAVAAGFVLLLAGGSRLLRDGAVAFAGAGSSAPAAVAIYSLVLAAACQAVRLPIACYQGFLLDRRYGLAVGSLSAWLRDYARSAALFIVLAIGAAETIYVSMGWFPRWWWLVSAAVLAAALLGLARLAPVVLLPLFYRLEPLQRASLGERLRALCARARVPALGAYVWGLGDKTRRANAVLVGTGATRRVLLSDTLLADYSDEEIEVVLAHEIGHHVHGDIRRGLVLEALLLVAALGLGAAALEAFWPALGVDGPFDVAGAPVLALTAVLLSLAAAPALNALSRRAERRADRYALTLTNRPEAFITAMRRLGAQNLAEERPTRTARWLFHSHPTVEERIESARAWISGR